MKTKKNNTTYHLSKSDINRLQHDIKITTPKQTKDKEKLAKQREKFVGTCKVCGEPLTYVTGNILVCTNHGCQGVTKFEGTEFESHESYYRLLDDKGAEIAENLFYEGCI